MKKIVWRVMVASCALTLWGCAIPQKSTVPPPPPSRLHKSSTVPGYPPPSGPVSEMKGSGEIVSPHQPVGVGSQQGKEGIEETEVDLASMAYIDGRIYEYGRKLDRWKELDSQSVAMALEDKDAAEMVKCFRRLQNVLNGYQDLRTRLVQAQKAFVAPDISRETLTELQKEDIAFLEDSCGRLLAGSGEIQPGWSKREAGA
ncbi:MAG: hypothetical protein ACWGOX_03945, partial [Desulforhopalus sp.]